MMPNSRFDLAEIARSALNDMPDSKRAAFLAEILTELRGPQAIEHLSQARAAVSLRMQELIDEKFPLHELAEVYGDVPVVRARTIAARNPKPKESLFDLTAARRQASIDRQRRVNAARPPAVGWRDVPRICLPGWFIHKEVGRLTGLLSLVGPSICRRLERHAEQPGDSQAPARPAALLRSAALWLTRSPNDAQQAIREQKLDARSSEPKRGPLPGSGQ